jgi:TolB-like protein
MPKAMAVLVYLAERPGQVVSTDELVEAVWHGRPMGDNPVYKCITQLRTVLGDDRKSPSFIETVHTKGYRLIAPVVWRNTDEPVDRGALSGGETPSTHGRGIRHPLLWASSLATVCLLAAYVFSSRDGAGGREGQAVPATMAEQPSIAVLPFVNMSPDPGQDYFADGLTEELITQLAKLRGLRVIGRTSSFAFKGRNEDLRTVGRTLGVNHVLEGGVRKTDQRVRVTVQLIDPADGTHLWSQVYDRSLEDVFTIQEEIAKTVASALHIVIGVRVFARLVTRAGGEVGDY